MNLILELPVVIFFPNPRNQPLTTWLCNIQALSSIFYYNSIVHPRALSFLFYDLSITSSNYHHTVLKTGLGGVVVRIVEGAFVPVSSLS